MTKIEMYEYLCQFSASTVPNPPLILTTRVRADFRGNPGGQRRAFAAAGPASDETSSYALCSYGADRLEHLRTDPVGDRAAPQSGDALGCETFRSPLVRLAESTDDLAPVVAALAKVGSSGVERAGSIPVSGLTDMADMEAGESIPVGALAEALQRKAPGTRSASPCAAASCEAAERPRASNTVYSLFAELRRVFD